jgi:hypothetical protein
MDVKVFTIYKVPVAISITLAIVLIALGTIRAPLEIAALLTGTFLGTFVLDLEYLLTAVVLEPTKDFSKTLVGFVKHSDLANAVKHIYYHKDEFKENSLNSAIFQVILAGLSILVVYSTRSLFAQAFVLSIFANSIYVLFDYLFHNKTDEWFWALKNKPNRQQVYFYIFAMLIVFSLCLYLFA